MTRTEPTKGLDEAQGAAGKEREIGRSGLKDRESAMPGRGKGAGMDLGL